MYNLVIDDDFVAYLLAAGFHTYGSPVKHCLDLHNGQYTVAIKHHTVSFWQRIDGDDDTAPDIHNFGSVYGIDQLDFFSWTLILHAFGIVPLKNMIQEGRRREPGLFEQLGAAFKPIAAH